MLRLIPNLRLLPVKFGGGGERLEEGGVSEGEGVKVWVLLKGNLG